MTYASRNWHAVETSDLVGSKHTLTVTGEVEVRKSNEEPTLAEAVPPGISPASLILELSVSGASDIGGEVVLWKDVEFVREISARQYAEVMITGEIDDQTVKVERTLS